MMKAQLKKLNAFMLVIAISFSSILHAEEMTLPVITKPSVLQEGTQRELTPDQIAELLPWAKNSKIFLSDLLRSLQGLSANDQLDRLISGVKTVVTESSPKNSEMLMRYALNRSLVLSETLSAEMDSDVVGTVDAKLRVLKLSIQMALKYYDADLAVMSKKQAVPFAEFGKQYFEFLNELNKSIFDASAQYTIQRTALEWLQWDLYRDLNNASFAPQIVKINNGLKIYTAKKQSDAQAIANIRQLKLLISGLELDGVRVLRVNGGSYHGGAQDVFVSNEKPDYSSPNFKECYRLREKSVSSDVATAQCFESIKTNGFNFRSATFKKCYEISVLSQYANDVVNACVKEISKSQFDYTSPNFLSCYNKKNKSLYSHSAAAQCVDNIQKNQNIDFGGKNFESCYVKTEKSVYANIAVDNCIAKMKSGVDFNSDNFNSCYVKMEKSIYAHSAVDKCTEYITTIDFDFLDSNFQSCHTLRAQSMYSHIAVEKCVAELK